MPEQEEEHKDLGFKVTDRRKFTTEGELRPDVAPEASTPQAPPPKPEPQPSPPPKQEAAPPPRHEEEPPGTETPFERLVISFASTAMMQLGLVAVDPEQPLEPDLPAARDTIDMLGVLQEKTRGNLSAREEQMLKNALAELRMAFVEVQRQKGAGL